MSEPSTATGQARTKRRRRHRRRWRWLRKIRSRALPVILTAVSILVIIGVLTAVLISNALLDVESAQTSLNRRFEGLNQSPATELSLKDFDDISATVRELNAALHRLDSRTRLFQPLVSFVGHDIEIQIELMDAGIHLTTGTNHFLNGLEPTIVLLQREGVLEGDESGNTVSTAKGRRIVELMDAGRNQFVKAESELQLALDILNGIELDGISAELLLDVKDFQDFVEQIQSSNNLALESPELLTSVLGIGEPRTYLILAQNNDEIRPSGGYISTWGWIRVRSGRIQDQEYFPTTSTSPSPPPASVAESFEVPAWWGEYGEPIYAAWDGSWYADFSATAEMAVWYYNNGNNPSRPVNGAIGVDLIAVEYLVEALGEVYVPEYSVMIDAEHFREAVYDIRAGRDTPLEHKRFVAAMFSSIITEWQRSDLETQSAMYRALLRALREKHLMLHFSDETVQSAVEELGWGGTQSKARDHDYLMVAEANIRANKSSSSIYRQITYDVQIEASGEVQSALTAFYDFPASLAEQDPAFAPEHYGFNKDYGALIQVFVPSGSDLVSGAMSSTVEIVEQPNHTVQVDFLTILYDDSALVEVDYTNAYQPESIGPYKYYRLLLQKQPGTRNDPANITVSLPAGTRVVSVSPKPNAQYNLGRPVLEFNLLLRQDEWIEVIYE